MPPMPSTYHASRRSSDGDVAPRSTSLYSAALKRSASKRRMTSSRVKPDGHQDPERVRHVADSRASG